jgi:hypothetical protein
MTERERQQRMILEQWRRDHEQRERDYELAEQTRIADDARREYNYHLDSRNREQGFVC